MQTFERDNQATQAEYSQVKQKIDAQAKSDRNRAKKTHEDARWQALAMYEAARDGTVKSRKRDEEMLAASRADYENLKEMARPVLARCKKLAGVEPAASAQTPPVVAVTTAATDPDATDPGEMSQVTTLQQAIKRADDELLALERLKTPGFLQLQNFVWPFLALGAGAIVGLGLTIGWTGGAIAGALLTVALAAGCYFGLASLARPKVALHYYPLLRARERRTPARGDRGVGEGGIRAPPARLGTEPRTRSEESRRDAGTQAGRGRSTAAA